MKPLGALALAISLPFVAPASQAVEYGATKAGDALIEGGKQMVEDTVDVAQDFFEDIRRYFER